MGFGVANPIDAILCHDSRTSLRHQTPRENCLLVTQKWRRRRKRRQLLNATHSSIFLLLLLLRPCLSDAVASASADAERSTIDSGYSRTASYIMKAAMKLPPHILPTLDEIATTTEATSTTRDFVKAGKEFETAVGVYLPGKQKDVGIYLPKKKSHVQRQNDALFKRETQESDVRTNNVKNVNLTPEARPPPPRQKRRSLKNKKQRNRSRLKIPFDPKKPLDLASSLGTRIKEIRRNVASNIRGVKNRRRPKSRRRRKQRGPTHFPKRKRRKNKIELPVGPTTTPAPYPFQAPDFDLPPLPEYLEEAERTRKLTKVPENPYVPKFVKELLARTFLKNPDAYIEYLRRREQDKDRGLVSEEEMGYIDWVDDEPYYRTPPPPPSRGLSSGEVRELLSFVERRPQSRPGGAKRRPNGLRGRRKNKNRLAGNNNVDQLRAKKDTKRNPFITPLSKHFPVPKESLLQSWRDPLHPTFAPPTAATTTSTTSQVRGRKKKMQERRKRKKNNPYAYEGDYLQSPTVSYPSATLQNPNPPSPAAPRSTICICCGPDNKNNDNNNNNNGAQRRRRRLRNRNRLGIKNRRILRLSDRAQVDRLLTERAMIESEVDCAQMQPVEVTLVFDTKNMNDNNNKRKRQNRPPFSPSLIDPTPVTLTAATLGNHVNEVFGDDDYSDYLDDFSEVQTSAYYDPTKLGFIFATPSPLKRRFLQLREQRAQVRDVNRANLLDKSASPNIINLQKKDITPSYTSSSSGYDRPSADNAWSKHLDTSRDVRPTAWSERHDASSHDVRSRSQHHGPSSGGHVRLTDADGKVWPRHHDASTNKTPFHGVSTTNPGSPPYHTSLGDAAANNLGSQSHYHTSPGDTGSAYHPSPTGSGSAYHPSPIDTGSAYHPSPTNTGLLRHPPPTSSSPVYFEPASSEPVPTTVQSPPPFLPLETTFSHKFRRRLG